MELKQTIDLVEGMYSFALIDKINSKLFLGRDLFGEKPLYYLNNNEEIIFSSELHNVNEKFFKIDQKAVNQFLHYNYIPNSSCIYKNWKKSIQERLSFLIKIIKKIFIIILKKKLIFRIHIKKSNF